MSDEIRSQFGQFPEIRLIVQPVTRNPDGTPKVHDIAGHLIFDFTLPPTAPAQVAAALFARLRALESARVDVILCRNFDAHGLGLAIRDRLLRAAGGHVALL